MADFSRERLLRHLALQGQTLAEMTADAPQSPSDTELLMRIRDQIFVIRETLDTLGVPMALASHDDWRRTIPSAPA